MIKVSVIIPVYNSEKYLSDCLASVAGQSLRDIEIICVNDGSTDGSEKILNDFAQKDARFKIINQNNSGAAAARNAGLANAKGKYLSFLDSDDLFEEFMLEKLYKKAEEENADIVVSNSSEFDDERVVPSDYHLKTKYLPKDKSVVSYKDIPEYIFNFTIGWAWDKLYKSDFVRESGLEFQNLRTTNDVYFVFVSLVKANRITVLDEKLIKHRVNTANQLSNTRTKSPLCFLDAINAIKDKLDSDGLYEFVKQSFLNWVMEHTVWQYRTLKSEELRQKLINEFYPKLNIFAHDEDYYYDKIAYQRMLGFVGWDSIPREPKVSVVLPIFNAEEYLDKCLKSLISQTLKDIEIICINDGSTDGSLELLNTYAESDKRIRVINQGNSGVGKANNVGMDVSKGKYIGFVEPDDYVKTNMFETLYKTAVNNDVDFVKADFINFDDDGNLVYRKLNTDGKFYNKPINMGDSITPFRFIMNTWCGIYKREFITKNSIRYNETPGASYQDNGFWFQTFCLAKRGYFIDVPLYMHKTDNPNASVKSKSKVFCMKEEYDFIREFLERHPDLKEKYLGIYHYKKYHNYMFTMNRIDESFKPLFLKTFVEDFKTAYQNNEIDESIFRQDELERLQSILNSSFYSFPN